MTPKLYRPGDALTIWVSKGNRLATVLAVKDGQILVEYNMPSGTTGLRFLRPPFTSSTHVNYRALSSAWLQAIVDQRMTWVGKPFTRTEHTPVPSPQALLEQKKLVE